MKCTQSRSDISYQIPFVTVSYQIPHFISIAHCITINKLKINQVLCLLLPCSDRVHIPFWKTEPSLAVPPLWKSKHVNCLHRKVNCFYVAMLQFRLEFGVKNLISCVKGTQRSLQTHRTIPQSRMQLFASQRIGTEKSFQQRHFTNNIWNTPECSHSVHNFCL